MGVSGLGYHFFGGLQGIQKEHHHFGRPLKKDSPTYTAGHTHFSSSALFSLLATALSKQASLRRDHQSSK